MYGNLACLSMCYCYSGHWQGRIEVVIMIIQNNRITEQQNNRITEQLLYYNYSFISTDNTEHILDYCVFIYTCMQLSILHDFQYFRPSQLLSDRNGQLGGLIVRICLLILCNTYCNYSFGKTIYMSYCTNYVACCLSSFCLSTCYRCWTVVKEIDHQKGCPLGFGPFAYWTWIDGIDNLIER